MHIAKDKRRRTGALVAVLALWASGCNRQLPAAPTPQRIKPNVPASAPAPEGSGQLVIDVVDGSTQVQRVRMEPTPVADDQGRVHYEFAEVTEALCDSTPCSLNLPVGNLLLGFPVRGNPEAMDVELVHVGNEATVYRRALTFHKPRDPGPSRTLGIVSTSVGGMAMVSSAALIPVGLAKDSDGMALAGVITLGAGTVLTALGILAMWGTGSTYQPGSAIHYSF